MRVFPLNTKNLLLASSLTVCAAMPVFSYAFPELDLGAVQPIFGVDVQHRNMEFQEGFGENLWKQTYPQTNLYAGMRFGRYFGFVLGHENSKTRTQTVNLSVGETFLGLPIGLPVTQSETFRGSSDIKGTYAQLMGYYPIGFLKSTELFLGIGAIHNKITLEQQALGNDDDPLTPAAIGEFYRNYSASNTRAKVELGLQKIICHHFGLRAVLGWEQTSGFKNIKPVQIPEAEENINLNDTWTVGMGFFWVF